MKRNQRPLPVVFAKFGLIGVVFINASVFLVPSVLIAACFLLGSKSNAATNANSLRELEQLVRTGYDSKALKYIESLGQERSTTVQKFDLSQTADFLIGRKKWQLATRYLEVFPQSEPGWGYVLIKQRVEDAKGDPQKLDDTSKRIQMILNC
jgi:hypothetical protein